jgi:hypothetical protein
MTHAPVERYPLLVFARKPMQREYHMEASC